MNIFSLLIGILLDSYKIDYVQFYIQIKATSFSPRLVHNSISKILLTV